MPRALLVCLATLVALLALAQSARAGGLSELAANAKRSVVHLDVLDGRGRKVGSGSGFFVSQDGRIVTNHHVIDQAGGMVAVMYDGRRVPVLGVLAQDQDHDLAVIQASPGEYEPLPLGSSNSIKVSDEVAVIGSPVGLAGTLSVGIVSAIRPNGPNLDGEERTRFSTEGWTIQITASISAGSSGSPVMETENGTVIAVAVGQRRDGQSLNFAVPIEHAHTLLSNIGPNSQPVPFAREVRTQGILVNLLISGAFFGGLALVWWGVGRMRRPKKVLS